MSRKNLKMSSKFYFYETRQFFIAIRSYWLGIRVLHFFHHLFCWNFILFWGRILFNKILGLWFLSHMGAVETLLYEILKTRSKNCWFSIPYSANGYQLIDQIWNNWPNFCFFPRLFSFSIKWRYRIVSIQWKGHSPPTSERVIGLQNIWSTSYYVIFYFSLFSCTIFMGIYRFNFYSFNFWLRCCL